MNFIKNILFDFLYENFFTWETSKIGSFIIKFQEIFLKYFFEFLLIFFQNIILLLSQFITIFFRFFIFYFFKCCKICFNGIIIFKRKAYILFLNINQFIFDLKTDYETIKQQSNIRSKKIFQDNQLIILEEWFELNQNYPYANSTVKQELATKTNLSVTQVKNWIDHKRAQVKNQRECRSCRFTTGNRLILTESFRKNQNQTHEDIEHLVEITGLTKKQVKSWFIKEKFKLKLQKT